MSPPKEQRTSKSAATPRARAPRRSSHNRESDATGRPALGPSKATRIRDFFQRVNDEAGQGLTARDAKRRWDATVYGPLPPNFSGTLSMLAAKGDLLIVGTYLNTSVYASPRVSADKQIRGRQLDDMVLEALVACVTAAGVPVLTTAVNQALADKFPRSLSMIDDLLRVLAGRESVTVDGRPHRVVGCQHVLPSGISRWTWDVVPLDELEKRAAAPAVPSVISTRHAVVLTVEATRALLGTPPNRIEWRLYVEQARANDPVARAVGKTAGFRRLASSVLFKEDGTPLSEGFSYGLQRYVTRFGQLGLADCRYGLVPPVRRETTHGTPIELPSSTDLPGLSDAAEVLDALGASRLHQEINALEILRDWWEDERRRLGAASRSRFPVIESLLWVRTGLLLSTMAMALPLDRWPAALDAAEQHVDTLDAWILRSPRAPARKYRFRKQLVRLPRKALATIRQWLLSDDESESEYRDRAAAAELQASTKHAPLYGAADTQLMRSIYDARYKVHPQPLIFANTFRDARTAYDPDPRPGIAEAEGEGSLPRGLRDRVDVWMIAFESAEAYTACSLLQGAERLLGSLLRDPSYLKELQAKAPREARDLHHELWVARGLLGSAPSPEEIASATSTADGRALLLATFLADPAAVAKNVRAIIAAWRAKPGSAGELLSDLALNAMVRVRSDEAFLLIE